MEPIFIYGGYKFNIEAHIRRHSCLTQYWLTFLLFRIFYSTTLVTNRRSFLSTQTMWLWKLNSRRMLLTKVLFVLFNQLMVIAVYGKLCETETGQNNIILDIEESRGDGKCETYCKLYFLIFLLTCMWILKWISADKAERCNATFNFRESLFLSEETSEKRMA